jgi:hypothetical protein
MRPPSWILLTFLLSLALGSCSLSQNGVEDLQTTVPENTESTSAGTSAISGPTVRATTTAPFNEANATATTLPETSITPAVATETGAWTEYQNAQAGYSAQYPSDWTVTESVGQNGELIIAFKAPAGEQGISVNIPTSEAVVEGSPDIPNTRCQQVTISGFAGLRCFDTLTFNTSTTFTAHGRQYSIVTFGKHLDETVYQHFLDSFTVTP